MANWITCKPLEGRDPIFINMDNIISFSGNDLGTSIVHAGGEFMVADRPEIIAAKRDGVHDA